MDKPRCLVCNIEAEIHHLYSRKAYPEYKHSEFNLMPLCRIHHSAIHIIGRSGFIERYKLDKWMTDKQWEICNLTGKWFHAVDNCKK